MSPTHDRDLIGPGRPLGASDLVPSALAFGGAPLGGLYEAVSDDEAQRTVTRALELGLRYLDTAPHYGLGISERRLGHALRGVPRDSYLLSTKVGRLLRPLAPGETVPDEGFAEAPSLKRVRDYSRDGIRRSIEESLERLGLGRVDIVYLHDPDEFETEVYETGYPALAELRSEGMIGAIGAGMNQAEMNSGLLANPTADGRYDYGTAPPALVDRAARMQEVCSRHGTALIAAALQFPLGHPAVASVLVGARSRREVDMNAGAFAASVPPAFWEELRGLGLLAEDIPVPAG